MVSLITQYCAREAVCQNLDWFPSHLVGFAFGPQQWWFGVIFKYPMIVLDWFSGIKGASPFSNLTGQSIHQVLIFCAPHKFLVVYLCIIGLQRYQSLCGVDTWSYNSLPWYPWSLNNVSGQLCVKTWLISQPFGLFCFWFTTVMILSDIQISNDCFGLIFWNKRCLTIL